MRHPLVNLVGLICILTCSYLGWTVVTGRHPWPASLMVAGPPGASSSSQGQRCLRPTLDMNNPLILKHIEVVPALKCAPERDWLSLSEGEVRLDPEAVKRHGNITCWLDMHERVDDFKSRVKETLTLDSDRGRLALPADFFQARCEAKDGATWRNIMAGVHRKQLKAATREEEAGGEPKWNVLMFGLDSMSRMHFMRKLPKTYGLLNGKMGAVVLEGYNIVGDGTPQALIPILTAFTEQELPDTRKRNWMTSYVNVYPWVWNNFSDRGYVTAFAEDTPDVGIFTYRLNGFKEKPTDHYMRAFYVEANKQFKDHPKLCLGSMPRHKAMLNWLRQFYEVYKDRPKFAFGFHGEISHDDYNLVGVADDDITDFIVGLRDKGLLKDTFLIIMSDHGHRFSPVRALAQGKQEERLPFFSITAPDSFKERHPLLFQNLKSNAQRLTCPFDLHPTFLSLLNTSAVPAVGDLAYRNISLFSRIPEERTCAQAGIEPHFCTCLAWESVSPEEPESKQASQAVVDFINQYTSEQESQCARLTLKQVTRAERYQADKALLSYKGVLDKDGFVPDLTDNVQAQSVLYSVQFRVHPSDGLYEASVFFDSKARTYLVDQKDISRVNMYGSQPHCVQEQLPHLMKYCYCKVQKS